MGAVDRAAGTGYRRNCDGCSDGPKGLSSIELRRAPGRECPPHGEYHGAHSPIRERASALLLKNSVPVSSCFRIEILFLQPPRVFPARAVVLTASAEVAAVTSRESNGYPIGTRLASRPLPGGMRD
jgi:hypothetical protein